MLNIYGSTRVHTSAVIIIIIFIIIGKQLAMLLCVAMTRPAWPLSPIIITIYSYSKFVKYNFNISQKSANNNK